MIYILLNSIGVVLSGTIGMLLKNRIKEEQINTIYTLVAILILVLAIDGARQMDHILIICLSLFLGSLVGTSLRIEDRIRAKANSLVKADSSQLVNGTISIVLVTCMGSMAILGPLNIALKGDPTLMNFKTILDTVMSLAFATKYGKSIFPAAVIIFIYQMVFYLVGSLISPILTEAIIMQIGQLGSIILIVLSMNMLGICNIKIMDLLPSLIFPLIFGLAGSLIL